MRHALNLRRSALHAVFSRSTAILAFHRGACIDSAIASAPMYCRTSSATPYALKPYGTDNFMDPAGSSFGTLAKDSFILVAQDVLGRYASEGTYMHVRPFNPNKGPKDFDESTDTWDTIEWLVKNVPNNNGNVGMFGISYPGFRC